MNNNGNMLIRVAQYYLPPYANVCLDEDECREPGFETLYLITQLTALKFSLDFISVPSIEDMLTLLKNGSADITGTTMPLTSSYYENFSATNPILSDKALLMVKSTKVESRNLLFSMCEWTVWLLLFWLLVFVVSFKTLAKKWVFVKPLADINLSITTDLPFAMWGLLFTIIFYTYTSFLAIIFSQKTQTPFPFKSFDTLTSKLAQGDCRLYINSSLANYVWYMLPDGVHYGDFAKIIKTKVVQDVPDEKALVAKVLESSCNVALIYMTEKPLYETLSCNVQFLDFDEFPTLPYVYYYRKNYEYGKQLGKLEAASDYYNINIKKYAKKRYIEQGMFNETGEFNTHCVNDKNDNRVDPLSLWQLTDSFILLLIGIGLAGLLLIGNVFGRNFAFSKLILHRLSTVSSKSHQPIVQSFRLNDFIIDSTFKSAFDRTVNKSFKSAFD